MHFTPWIKILANFFGLLLSMFGVLLLIAIYFEIDDWDEEEEEGF